MQTLQTLLQEHVNANMTRANVWPDEAEYAVVYNTSTWPCGFGKESNVIFFNSLIEKDKFLAKMQDWSRLEDNYFAFQVYSWDLGPNLLAFECSMTGNLCMTYEERRTYEFGDTK